MAKEAILEPSRPSLPTSSLSPLRTTRESTCVNSASIKLKALWSPCVYRSHLSFSFYSPVLPAYLYHASQRLSQNLWWLYISIIFTWSFTYSNKFSSWLFSYSNHHDFTNIARSSWEDEDFYCSRTNSCGFGASSRILLHSYSGSSAGGVQIIAIKFSSHSLLVSLWKCLLQLLSKLLIIISSFESALTRNVGGAGLRDAHTTAFEPPSLSRLEWFSVIVTRSCSSTISFSS